MRILAAHIILWKKTFWQVWEPLPFADKFSWLLFATNTIAVITLIEFLILS